MKNYTRLTLIEREEISRGLAAGQTLRQIANVLARPPSAVSRELSRLRYDETSYRATFADAVAIRRRNHRRDHRLVSNKPLQEYVIEHLRLRWSPQQIAESLKLKYPVLLPVQ
jgi:IS30 family transposase